jgi:phosphate starvation-inducible membrane PsiE
MWNFLQPPVTSSLLGRNILLSTLFSNTLNLCSSLYVRDQVPHSYKTTDKITVSYILIFEFLDSRREDKRFWTAW